MADVVLGPGSLIDGKFELTAKLGEGGMGSVWRAEHRTLNAPVAVKLLDPAIAKTEEGLARFLREAQAAAALRGSHVVQTFDYGVHEMVPYIVMELLIGESLAERIARKGPMPPPVVAILLKQVSRAMTKAHQAGIVHRDLKPENIFLVDTEEDELTAKVLDFGIAKAADSLGISTSSKTRTGALLGTPYYMSPEQAQGTKEVDYRTDLWALAVITFEALTGKRPFDSEALGDLLLKICAEPLPVPSLVATVPVGFDTWFARAAARDPEARFGTATEMAKSFEFMLEPGRVQMDSFRGLSNVTTSMTSPLVHLPIPVTLPAAAHHLSSPADSLEGTEVLATPTPGRARPRLITPVAVVVGLVTVVGTVLLLGPRSRDTTAISAVPRSPAAAKPAFEEAPVAAPRRAPIPVVVPVANPSALAAPSDSAPAPSAKHAAKSTAGKLATAPKTAVASSATEKPAFDPLQQRR